MRVVVIGSGAWGTVLAGLARRAGSEVTLVARNVAVRRSLLASRQHPVSVPAYRLAPDVRIVERAEEALASAPEVVVVVVPSAAVEVIGREIGAAGFRGVIVSATKGIDPASLRAPTERLAETIGAGARIAALSGPNLAGEIAAGHPAAAVVAAPDPETAASARVALMSDQYRIYTAHDVIGVEIAGALKNVIAIGAGIADGLGAGHNARAAYMTRGIAEMTRLGMALGANPLTFAGLAGIGDLIATCSSEASRNHTVGRGLAEGRPLEEILAAMAEVAEGVPTARAALQLGKVHGVELPIIAQIARVMYEGVPPATAIAALMARDATSELNFLPNM